MTSEASTSGVASAPSSPLGRPIDLGRCFGPYRTLERIGQGGMGEIFLAQRDDAYHQQVAIKVLRRGLDTDDMRWRFRRERQILAGLEHPYIARLYDGGTCEEGRPYLVMERVDGNPIDRFCDERRLDLRQRLELFVKVCEAVAFAHRGLLVHRDLKPNNILVQDDGVPKLLDFGIAKPLMPVADPDDPEAETQGPLTPGYASPEQVLGGIITTSSDVYSLGVLLYRLLCGHAPVRSIRDLMDGRTLPLPSGHFADAVRDEELERTLRRRRTRLSLLRQDLEGDLDHILLKALELEPSRRYPSASELARDIERHLQGRPVGAHPPRPLYVAGKFLRRHRRVGAALVLVALVLLSGLVSVERARREANVERHRAWQVQDFLLETFDLDPDASQMPALSAVQLLELSEERLRRRPGDDPWVEVHLRDALARMYSQLARHGRAEALSTEALAAQRRLQGDEVTSARLLAHLAHSTFHNGRLAAAEMHYRDALQRLQESGFGGWSGRSARQTLEVEGDILYGLSSIAWDRGRPDESEEFLRQTLALRRQLYEAPHRRIADVASDLAALLIATGRDVEGEPLLFEARDMYLQTLGEAHPSLFINQNHLAFLYYRRGDLDAAEAVYRQSMMRQIEHRGPDHPYARMVRRHLARTLMHDGRLEEAVQLMEFNLAFEARRDGLQVSEAEDLQLYGRLLRQLGRPEDAIEPLQRSLDIRRDLGLGRPVDRTSALYFLALAEADLQRPLALQRLRQVEVSFAEHLEPGAPEHTSVQFEIGRLLLRLGRPEEALSELQGALASLPAETLGAGSTEVAYIEALLGACQVALGQQEGHALLRRGVDVLERELGAAHRWTTEAASYLDVSKSERQ